MFEGAVRKWGVGDKTAAGYIAYLAKYFVFGTLILGMPEGVNRLADRGRPFLQLGLGLLFVGAAVSSAMELSSSGRL